MHSAVWGVHKPLFSFILMLRAWIACQMAMLHISWTVHVHVQYIIYRIFDLIGLHATRYYKAASIIAGRHFSGAAGEEISWIGLEDFTLRSGFLTPKAGKFLLKVYTHLTKCQVHASICLGLSFQGAQYVVNVHAIGGASEWSYGHGFLCRQPVLILTHKLCNRIYLLKDLDILHTSGMSSTSSLYVPC